MVRINCFGNPHHDMEGIIVELNNPVPSKHLISLIEDGKELSFWNFYLELVD